MDAEMKAAFDLLGTAIAGVGARLTAEIGRVESALTVRLDHVETDIGRVASGLTSRLDRLDCQVDRAETPLRTLIEQDVIPKIELVAEGVASAREQAERRLNAELGAFGPRTIVSEAVISDILRRIERLEERTP